MRIDCRDITFTYPEAAAPALSGCDLSLDTGEATLLVGDNGAGKSTAIRLLTGQLAAFAGSFAVDGNPAPVLCGDLLARFGWGYAPDQPVLDPYLTGAEILDFVRRRRGLDEREYRPQWEELREALALGEWMEDGLCREYSKGMRKKVGLAVAFLGRLSYVFLDEPLDGLDPISAYGLKRLIAHRRAAGQGVLLSSHQLDAAEKLADKVIFMKKGRILFAGGRQALQDRWAHKGSLEEIFLELYASD